MPAMTCVRREQEHPKEPSSASFPDASPVEGLAAPVEHAIRRTRQWLLAEQDDDGSWCAELEGDTILESETILMLAFLGREHTPLARRAAAYLVRKQLPERRLGQVPRRQARHQRQREGLFRPEADGPRPGGRIHGARRGARSAPTAGPTPSTALRDSTWPSWDRFPTNIAPPFRRKWSSCRNGSP